MRVIGLSNKVLIKCFDRKMCMLVWTFVVLIHNSYGIGYNVNGSDHDRMPPLYHLQDYDSCLVSGGRYCTIDFTIVSERKHDLYNMIQEHSSYTQMHFNHSKLLHGKCLAEFCPKAENLTEKKALRETLETCLNESFTKTYDLQANIEKFSCSGDNKLEIEIVDIIVGLIVLIPIVLTVFGSVHHYVVDSNSRDEKFLACFSLPRNLKSLFAERPAAADPRKEGLHSFHGMRAITSAFVIVFHASLPLAIGNDNPNIFEEAFKIFKYVASGTLIVQTFFIMSGFLLSYNILVFREKNSFKACDAPKKIFLRWLRLTPPLIFVLAIICTVLRFTEHGPLWQTNIGDLVKDCQSDWWIVHTYFINYVDGSQCMPELWYLAADFQLTIFGLLSMVYMRGWFRMIVLLCLMVAGLVIPSLHVYFQNLDIATVSKIQAGRDFFVKDASFNQLYKRTHNNITDYIMGMITGLMVYHGQVKGWDLKKYPILRYITWLSVPLGLSVILTGSYFYREEVPTVGTRILYLVVSRVVWGLMGCMLIVDFGFGIEKLYSGILSWHVWTVPSRLSYIAYVTHVFVIRCLNGFNTTLVHITPLFIVWILFISVILSYLVAAPIWLLIEAPVVNVIKIVMKSKNTKEDPSNNAGENQATLSQNPTESEKYKKISEDQL